jgi:hypothetical protein
VSSFKNNIKSVELIFTQHTYDKVNILLRVLRYEIV